MEEIKNGRKDIKYITGKEGRRGYFEYLLGNLSTFRAISQTSEADRSNNEEEERNNDCGLHYIIALGDTEVLLNRKGG